MVESHWLKRNSVGGDLSLLRIKVPWPLAMREVLLSEYELEYFEEDLIVVMYASVCFGSPYTFISFAIPCLCWCIPSNF
jgi:hypothetical protein